MKEKKGAVLGLSFGVIFSIILIVFFILIAFIAINAFLDSKDCAKIGIFLNKFQRDVDKAWNSQSDDFTFKGSLPNKIEFVCFFDTVKGTRGTYEEIGFELSRFEGGGANMFFYPTEKSCDIPKHTINHIDLEVMTTRQNPFCVSVDKGLLDVRIFKEFNDRSVTVTLDDVK